MRQQQAGAAHVHALPHAQVQRPLAAQRRAQRRHRRRCAARGGIFRHASGEHPSLDVRRRVHGVPPGIGRVHIAGLRAIQRQQGRIAIRIRRRAAQGIPAA
ncbi:hypothetical protein G6F68_019719 [Rhizopus microsporus]|nr:hypothetical protein G6F68_019719 [Rhizopus microsporus]